MSLVTVSASYGAGGSKVAPALARRLEVPFVDRLIPVQVAEGLGVSAAEVRAHGERPRGLVARLLALIGPTGEAFGSESPAYSRVTDHEFLEMTERVILECATSGRGVILGRAAAVVLRDDPRALHVRLDAPPEARLAQAMRIQSIDRETAQRRMTETDRARHAYVRHFHHANARDPDLYHVVLDSTAIDLDACVELIASAAESRAAHAVA